jgi:hypothetical protein
MTVPVEPAASDSQQPKIKWSPETRTWVSLLLFVHLFAVVVAVTTYTRPSALQRRLHGVFAPYLRNLHLTALPSSYPFARFHLTFAGESDVDYSVEVDTLLVDGTTETIELPRTPLQPLVRWRRYQALANAAGTLSSGDMGDAATSILPKAIAGGILRSENATGGAIRIRAFGIPDENSLDSLEAVARAAKENVSDVYEAQVILGPSGVELLRKSTTLDSAPIENQTPAANRTPDQNAPRGPAASSTAPPAAAAPLQPGAQP